MRADGGTFRKANISCLVLEVWLQPSLPGTSVSNKQNPQPWCILANSDPEFAKQAQELFEGSDVLCQKEVSQVCKENYPRRGTYPDCFPHEVDSSRM